MRLHVTSEKNEYDVFAGENLLERAGEFFDLDRKALLVTDGGVPRAYAETLASLCREPHIVTLAPGEDSKSLENWRTVLSVMLEKGFTRGDCVVAVGGGVVGDLAGFAASSYMRGVDFYNLPTTVLSMVDSSIGGKTAVNFGGVKNIVGAFYAPKAVVADFGLLSTLPRRQVANGLAEALKMALTFDAELFSLFEREDPFSLLPEIIPRALAIKKETVEKDEREKGLRKVLNFGHTLGHGIEVTDGALLHGECVALGMIPMCAEGVRARLLPVLEKLGLPCARALDREAVLRAVSHDKKTGKEGVDAVFCTEVGTFEMKTVDLAFLKEQLKLIDGREGR